MSDEQAEQVGMKVSLPGVLSRAREVCLREPGSEHLAWSLDLLLAHLRIVRKQPGRLRDFFDLWVDP